MEEEKKETFQMIGAEKTEHSLNSWAETQINAGTGVCE